LKERSRRPHHHPKQTPQKVVDVVLAARRAHPSWGPRKLKAWLQRREPKLELPASSTMGEILKRAGLVQPRRRKKTVSTQPWPLTESTSPNGVWCADFKGHFRLGSGRRCYPLTLTDNYSRYLLACQGLPAETISLSREVFERVFQEYGLPEVIRSDNGRPFASRAPGGLSRLLAWWVKLGIRPERIAPGKPEQNGRHERMHKTLKAETARPPRANATIQQRAFDQFRWEFNRERPHEALDDDVPAMHYQDSPRPYPYRLPEPDYPGHFEVRRIPPSGMLKWRGRQLYATEVLGKELVGLEEVADGAWLIHFYALTIGVLDERRQQIRPFPGHKPRPS